MFPITYRHQFNYNVQGDERWIAGVLLARIATALEKEGAQNITIENQRLAFEGRFLSILYPNWRLLSAISKGEVFITCQSGQMNISFQISFIGLVFILLLMSGFFGVGIFGYFRLPTPEALKLCIISLGMIWAWIFGMNVLLTSFRFRGFMQDQIGEFFHSTAHLGILGERITSR